MTNILREIRESKGVSASALARMSGVSRYSIYLIETGKNRNVKASTMRAIADALKEKPEHIFLF